MTKTYFTEEGVQVSGEGLDHLREAVTDLEAARAETEQLKAEIARLGRELNLAKYGEPDFSWSIHKEAMADLLDRAEKAEAERDEALAQAAMAFEVAAKLPTTPEWRWRFEPHWSASDMATEIRALTPADAKAALEAYGREKVREGMNRAADVAEDYCANEPALAGHGYSAGIRDAILAEMEKNK